MMYPVTEVSDGANKRAHCGQGKVIQKDVFQRNSVAEMNAVTEVSDSVTWPRGFAASWATPTAATRVSSGASLFLPFHRRAVSAYSH